MFSPKDAESSTVRSRIANLYTNGEKYADCTFRIDDEQIHCHKLILSTASPVFEAMFYGYFQSETIVIVDIAAKTFKLMIEFIYTDHINDSIESKAPEDDSCVLIETCIELIYCAEKYLLRNLRDKCLWKIHNKLNDKNMLRVLDFAMGSGILPLQELCLKTLRIMVLTNVKKIGQLALQTTKQYYHVSKECLQYIFACNRMIFEKDEIDISILLMINQWCRNEADDRRRQMCAREGSDHSDAYTYSHIVAELNLPSKIAAILCDDFALPADTCYHSAFRNSYKSTGILKIYAGHVHTVCIETSHTIALKTLIVLSRLLSSHALLPLANSRHNERRTVRYSPLWHQMASKRTYDEEFSVKFVSAKNGKILHAEKFQPKNVEYNSKMFLTFRKPVEVAREQRIRIIFERPSAASECFSEYPCKFYKNIEYLEDGLCVDFNPDTAENVKCILDGIEYAQID